MIPKILKIKGLYSYREEQVVDFSKLTEAGLFGIFGEVGSGKSTILEAMIFCIYGKSERMKQSGENRNYNMMNLMMNESEIDFTFTAGVPETEFNIYYKFGRNRNNFDDVIIRADQYYRIEDGIKIPISHQEIIDAVGLTYENFKMTVIIPQGKFRDFIELTNAERSKMLKELFRLHDFDLFSNVKKLEQENDSLLNQKNGEISAYQFEDAQKIADKENILARLVKELGSLSLELTELEKVVQDGKELKNLLELLEKHQEEFKKLIEDAAPIQQLEKELDEYILIKNNFKSLYEEEYKINKRLSEENETSKNYLQLKTRIKSEIEILKLDLEKSTKEFNSIESLKTEAEEYEKLAEYLVYSKEEQRCKKEKNDIQNLIVNQEREIQNQKIIIADFEIKIEALKKLIIPENVIFEVKQWFFEEEKEKQQIDDLNKSIQDLQNRQRLSEDQFKKLIDTINETINWTQRQEIENIFQKRKLLFQQELDHLLEEKTSLGIKIELSKHATHLEDGSPCMLCGSTHHPIPLNIHLNGDEMNLLEHKIKVAHKKISEDWDVFREIMECYNEKNQLETFIDDAQKKLSDKKSIYSSSFTEIPNNIYLFKDKIDFNERIIHNNQYLSEIRELESNCNLINRKIESLKDDLFENQKKEVKWQADIQNAQNNIGKIRKEIKSLDIDLFFDADPQNLREKKRAVLLNVNNITQEYNSIKDQLTSKENESSSIEGSLKILLESISKNEIQLSETKEKIYLRLKEHHLEYDMVYHVLIKKLDEASIKKQIDFYQKKVSDKNSEINILKQKVGNRTFDHDQFNEKEKFLFVKKGRLQELLANKGGLENEIINSRKGLQKKQKLQSEIDALSVRKSDIDRLRSLFAGNGFVDFVSKRYLSNVVAIANMRFRKMVRQKYSLELKDGEIIIRDHMNEGKERSIKSLSGGQSFQAALSLALSLSENIQRNAGVNQHFFFLDEGFGSLDEDNLQIVFETLRSLQHENRIVGLISHVKALQQELDIHLMVTNDEQHGSRIVNSWSN